MREITMKIYVPELMEATIERQKAEINKLLEAISKWVDFHDVDIDDVSEFDCDRELAMTYYDVLEDNTNTGSSV